MKDAITRADFFRGLIAAVVAFAILLGLEAVERGLPERTDAVAETLSVSADIEGEYQPGTYSASANGFGGPVEVTLTVGENGGITDADIVGDGETPDVGGAAIPQLAAQLLSAQSAEIDGVSGASLTTGAVKQA
ncbi:MAG: FMN-binding protein, partial [Oscillibacter sp.]|nr:FMN-binding protein [Oscillibacter sp.]